LVEETAGLVKWEEAAATEERERAVAAAEVVQGPAAWATAAALATGGWATATAEGGAKAVDLVARATAWVGGTAVLAVSAAAGLAVAARGS
jgi:hypothetical protein